MEDAAITLLEGIHESIAKSEKHQAYLKTLVANPVTPPAMREMFADMYVNLGVLALYLQNMTEHNMEMTDQLDRILTKIENNHKE